MDSTEVNETSRNDKASNGKNPTLFLLFPGYLDKFESLNSMLEYKEAKNYFEKDSSKKVKMDRKQETKEPYNSSSRTELQSNIRHFNWKLWTRNHNICKSKARKSQG